MKIEILASTKLGHAISKEEALDFSGKSAALSYLSKKPATIFSEEPEKTEERTRKYLRRGPQSVFNHVTYNLLLIDIPKILAMVLNNEKAYNTTEKSGRATILKMTNDEAEYYSKWLENFKIIIKENYPDLPANKIQQLAQENARYVLSVFTPATTMEYTVGFAQLNYIAHWFRDFILHSKNTPFNINLKECFIEFINALPDLIVDDLDTSMKNRKLSLFARRSRAEHFDENYSINYRMSLAGLAQSQRHRTIHYEFSMPKDYAYHTPRILLITRFEKEWDRDMWTLRSTFPQAMIVKVNERGTAEDFILKAYDRLCGHSQLEIMLQTQRTLREYAHVARSTNRPLYEYLKPYRQGACCTFPGVVCKSPCPFGPENALKRTV